MTGRITFMAGEGQAVEAPLDGAAVPAGGARARRPSVQAPYVGAIVEIDGGGGLVEQRATQEAGTSVAPCTTDDVGALVPRRGLHRRRSRPSSSCCRTRSTSRSIVDIGFATDEGSRQPPELQGYPDPAALGAGHRPGLDRRARRGAGRDQRRSPRGARWSSGGPSSTTAAAGSGYSMTLASPTLRVAVVVRQRQQGRRDHPSASASTTRPTDDVAGRRRCTSASGDAQVTVDPITVPGRRGRDVHVRRRRRAARRPPRRRVRHRRLRAVAGRRAGDHPHDRRHPDDVGAARRGRHARTATCRRRGRWRSGRASRPSDALVVYNSTSQAGDGHGPGGDADGARRTCPALEEVALPAAGLVVDPAHRPVRARRPARRPVDDAGVRRAVAAPGAGRPGPHDHVGRPAVM